MRIECDSMGEMQVPDGALYGASTQRAVLNFPVSGYRLPAPFLCSLGLVKSACARASVALGLLDPKKGKLVQQVANEIANGALGEHFPIDVFQTGSATSTNMNINEVIANRASQLTGQPIGSKKPLHPNDDVNLGQSSNDVIPTVLHVSVAVAILTDLQPALGALAMRLESKADAWRDVVKIGRTHLMDATPLTLGQEFSGYAAQIHKAEARCGRAIETLSELALGGTAVGTGLNTHVEFGAKVAGIISEETGLKFREAVNHFETQGARDDCVEVAGQLAAITAALSKIASDIRWLGSGPRAGFAELKLPATQPGSSIMPGKVNPVMSEMLIQVCLYTQGLTQTVQLAGRDGHFELNATLPLIAHCLHEAIRCLSAAVRTFTEKCVLGIEADAARCRELVDQSLMLVTALNPHIGYDAAAAVAKEAYTTGKMLREIVLEKKMLDAETLDAAFESLTMNKPGAISSGAGGG